MAEASESAAPAPRVLVVTSASARGDAVTPVLAALEASGTEVRALDVGRLHPTSGWRVWEAVLGELAERRLQQELAESPPDVALAFEPAAVSALAQARDDALEGAPVLAVVADLEPGAAWGQTDADRYLAIDDEAAVALADAGVAEDRVVVVGPMGERSFTEAAGQRRASVRERYGLSGGPIALVEIGGVGGEIASQVALQLSLLEEKPLFVFDAGGDAEAAQALRAQVPALELRAKLFGTSRDAPQFWRAADVIVARPRPRAIARALVLGARMVGLAPETEEEEALIAALERRGLGRAASNPLLLSGVLEPLLRESARTDDRIGADGAGCVADVAWVVARDRDRVLSESQSSRREARSARVDAATSGAESRARRAQAAGDLEDLGGGAEASAGAGAGDSGAGESDREEIDELLRQVGKRRERQKKRLVDARQAADEAQRRADRASARGEDDPAAEAQAKADKERARMHEILEELSELEKEISRLKDARAEARSGARASSRGSARASSGATGRASAGSAGSSGRASPGADSSGSIDDLLAKLKRDAASGGGTREGGSGGDLDDDLEALKRKMQESRRKR